MTVCPDLYLATYDLEYTSNPYEDVYYYDIKFPDDITIPANSVVNVDMKVRIAMYCPSKESKVYGLAALPKDAILDTPLIHALGCASMSNSDSAIDLHIPVRNVSDTDYDITTGDVLFQLVFMQYQPFSVHIVDLEHIMME